MAKINRNRLAALLSSVFFITLLIVGAVYLKNNFGPFAKTYVHQLNIDYVEKKYKKPYSAWLEESTTKCITDATKPRTKNLHSSNLLDPFITEQDITNQIHNICQSGYSEVLPSKNEIVIAYLKHTTVRILMSIAIAGGLSIFFGIFFAHWLPAGITKFLRWLTTSTSDNS